MNSNRRELLMQRWSIVQEELLPELWNEVGPLTPKLEKVIHTLEWVRLEEYVRASWCGLGRPPHERSWLANAFVAKVVLGITTTVGLIERLSVDRSLRRICGFPTQKVLPSEATFSRAFDEFAKARLAERVHEALIQKHLGKELIGHISRDGTAIEARERPCSVKATQAPSSVPTTTPATDAPPASQPTATVCDTPVAPKRRRGRPKSGEERQQTAKTSPLARQRIQTLAEMIEEIPTACDRGTKSNAQGYKVSWNGYKLHLDTADCGVPIAALLSSASMHDSRAAIPLSRISAQRVTNLYDLMDAAYCSHDLREDSRNLGHVPLIDHNPRGGEKIEFLPHEAIRYNERTAAERTNARLKDEFGASHLMVRGATKVMSHLMFGVLALCADQLMRLRS
ncbi:IS1182 family transposase [Candidatus Symbiobacter mobilis]|nr:IS1182 family transposase [Candidatus Symbiobacter mobilis]